MWLGSCVAEARMCDVLKTEGLAVRA
jgi:hypothetical protein